MGLMVAFLLGWNLYLIAKNQTSIENIRADEEAAKLRRTGRVSAYLSVIRTSFHIVPNIRQICGT
jgi:hypothetical protein